MGCGEASADIFLKQKGSSMPRKYIPVAVRRAREAQRRKGSGGPSSSSSSSSFTSATSSAATGRRGLSLSSSLSSCSSAATSDYTRALRGGKSLPELLRERWTDAARKQLSRWRRRDEYGYFHAPVPHELVPDYRDVIKRPMDFGTMESQLEQGSYSSYKAFAGDFRLVCRNAMTYNGPDTPYYKFAKILLDMGERAIAATTARLTSYTKRLAQEKRDYDRILREADARLKAEDRARMEAKMAAEAKALKAAKTAKAKKAAKAAAKIAKAAGPALSSAQSSEYSSEEGNEDDDDEEGDDDDDEDSGDEEDSSGEEAEMELDSEDSSGTEDSSDDDEYSLSEDESEESHEEDSDREKLSSSSPQKGQPTHTSASAAALTGRERRAAERAKKAEKLLAREARKQRHRERPRGRQAKRSSRKERVSNAIAPSLSRSGDVSTNGNGGENDGGGAPLVLSDARATGRLGSFDVDEIEENTRFWDFANSFIDDVPGASTLSLLSVNDKAHIAQEGMHFRTCWALQNEEVEPTFRGYEISQWMELRELLAAPDLRPYPSPEIPCAHLGGDTAVTANGANQDVGHSAANTGASSSSSLSSSSSSAQRAASKIRQDKNIHETKAQSQGRLLVGATGAAVTIKEEAPPKVWCSRGMLTLKITSEMGLLQDTSVRVATAADAEGVLHVNRVNKRYSNDVPYTVADYKVAIDTKNEFFLIAHRGVGRVRHPAAVGVVNYYCMWFTGSREERTKQNSHKTSKGDKIKLGRLTPARAMYIATLQAVKPDSHPELVKGKRGKNINSNAALSEPKTGIALMCLALEHARNLGMQIAVLDATESSVSFYRDIFGFTCMKPSEPRKYVPMMLHLRSFCPSIPLMARGPNSLVLATQFPSNSEGTSTPKTGRGTSTSRGQGGKGSSKSKGRGISRGKNRNSSPRILRDAVVRANLQLRLERSMESLDGAIKKKTLSQTLKARTSNKQAVTRDTFDISRDKGRQLGTELDNDGVRFSTCAVSRSPPALALSVFCQGSSDGQFRDNKKESGHGGQDFDEDVILKDGSLLDAAESLNVNGRRPCAALGGSDDGASRQFVQIFLDGGSDVGRGHAKRRVRGKKTQRKSSNTGGSSDMKNADVHFVSGSIEQLTHKYEPESRAEWNLGQGFGQSPFRVRPRLQPRNPGRQEPPSSLVVPRPVLTDKGDAKSYSARDNLIPSDARAAEEWHDVDEIADAIRETHADLVELHSSRAEVSCRR